MKNNCLHALIALSLLLIAELAFGARLPASDSAKTYAVFVVSYSSRTGQAVGGVAGTAFFVSKQEALTAYHVLQPSSFATTPEFEHRRVWLIHENEPAIEVRPEFLASQADRDATSIRFPREVRVPSQNIFELAANNSLASAPSARDLVVTEGFRANSVGPKLAWKGDEIEIVSVPALERLTAEGSLLQATNVRLASNDVNLKDAPCFQFSYRPVVGLSGGPVLAHGRVIAMNSFADPSRASTWALRLK